MAHTKGALGGSTVGGLGRWMLDTQELARVARMRGRVFSMFVAYPCPLYMFASVKQIQCKDMYSVIMLHAHTDMERVGHPYLFDCVDRLW